MNSFSVIIQCLSSLSNSPFALALLTFLSISLVILTRFIIPPAYTYNKPPLYGKGRTDQQAALQKGYDKVLLRFAIASIIASFNGLSFTGRCLSYIDPT